MKLITTLTLALAVGGPLLGAQAASEKPRRVRATRMKSKDWEALKRDGQQLDIEFRHGDRLPVELTARGDFFETEDESRVLLLVKRDFWLRLSDDAVLTSLDGEDFRPIGDIATGRFNVTVGSDSDDGVASHIEMGLEALVEP